MSIAEAAGAEGRLVIEHMQPGATGHGLFLRLRNRLFRIWFDPRVGRALQEVTREGLPAKVRHIGNARAALAKLDRPSRAAMNSAMAGLEQTAFPDHFIRGMSLGAAGSDDLGVVLYVPGGSFIAERSPRITAVIARIARESGARLCVVDYRLAPEHPCPAAVNDVRAAYESLLALYPPERIAVASESAGGAILLAALQGARDAGLAMPAAMAFLSPWVDLTVSSWSVVSKSLTAESPFSMELLALCAQIYLDGRPATDPLASPLFGNLAGLPPAIIHASEADLLYDDAARLAEGLRKAGSHVTFRVWAHEQHVFERLLGREGERSILEIARFLRTHLALAA